MPVQDEPDELLETQEGSAQRRAKQLLVMADAVQESFKSRRNLVQDLEQQRLSIVDDFEASNRDLGGSIVSTDDTVETEARAPSPTDSLVSTKSNKSKKQSKTKVIADLRKQLQDCQSALVEIKENASLKYLKLTMEHDDLQEALEKEKTKWNELEQENATLKRKLSSAVGADRVEWLTELESTQQRLEADLKLMTFERDALQQKLQQQSSNNQTCVACQSKATTTSSNPTTTPAADTPSSRGGVRSLWTLFQLDEEARVTEEATSSMVSLCGSSNGSACPPRPPSVHQREPNNNTKQEPPYLPPPHTIHEDEHTLGSLPSQEGSDAHDLIQEELEELEAQLPPPRHGDDLEADIQAMEQKMKEDIESMQSEWKSRPSKKRPKQPKKNNSKRRSSKRMSKRKSFQDTLSSYFSQIDLGEEEMDEEKSFYSMREQSFSSMPADSKSEKMKRQKSKRRISSTTSLASAPAYSSDRAYQSPVNGKDKKVVSPNLSPTGSSASIDASESSPDRDTSERVFGQDVQAMEVISGDEEQEEEDAETPEQKSKQQPVDRRSFMMKAARSVRNSLTSLMDEEEEQALKPSLDRRLDNLRAKSLRGDFAREKKKPPRPATALRSSQSVVDRKAVHWEDPSKEEDEKQLKIREEVEAWSAFDMAPITPL